FLSSTRRHTRWPRDWSSDVCSSDLGTARTHRSPDLGYESEVKSAGQSRWSPRWPVLPHRGCRSPRRLLLPQRGRWSPRWPVLPVLAVPSQPVVVPRSPPPSGKRLLFLDVHQWLARCAARAIRASLVPKLVVSSLRSRHCSYRRSL